MSVRRTQSFKTLFGFSLTFLLISFLNSAPSLGQEIGFLESYVLSEDRDKSLKELIPGTQEYYYFYSLHYQNTAKLDEVDKLLEPWVKRFGETAQVTQIRNRQALLKYSDNPQQTLEYLQSKLQLSFEHEREVPEAQQHLPTRIPDDATEFDKLLPKVIDQHRNTNSFSQAGLRKLANTELTTTRRRHLLQRVSHPSFPNLVKLISDDLHSKDKPSFGSLKIHSLLTTKQLDDLVQANPALKTDSKFVHLYLTRLAPSDDSNWRSNEDERRQYLERQWKFAQPLPPSFNSLKTCILFHLLKSEVHSGVYDRDRFITYLKLPRNVSYIQPSIIKSVESRNTIAQLGSNFLNQIQHPPVQTDESLVREFLHHFLRDANNYNEFEPYIRSEFLKREFATVKILSGMGDPEQWASQLTPSEYQQLIERIDLEFSARNQDRFEPDDEVELQIYTKNVDSLLVKIFEINTHNFYQKHQKEIGTDINLDGLIPNTELTFDYQDAPAIRTLRTFKFPQIKERGVYIVDFIAGGKSSRALIRKGRYHLTDQVSAAGQLFTVMDDEGKRVIDASLWISGARYYPNDVGQILVPFSTTPGITNAIVTHGDFNCLAKFDHVSETYALKAGLVVDRESLRRGKRVSVIIRPSLLVSDTRIPISLLENPQLIITSNSRDGIASTKTVGDLELNDDSETAAEFLVPARLKSISFTLTGRVKNISKGQTETVSVSQAYNINAIEDSEQTQDVHLVPAKEGYFLEVLGKTGETRPNQPVRVQLTTEHFKHKFSFSLRSNSKGLIYLGKIPNVHTVEAKLANAQTKIWPIHQQDQTYARTIHASPDGLIEIPAPAGIIDDHQGLLSLTEVRNQQFIADHTDSLEVKLGLIRIRDLKPGDYNLRINLKHRQGSTIFRDIRIRISAANLAKNILVRPHRHLETRGNLHLHVAAISNTERWMDIQLHNAGHNTRVHLLATRYQPAFSAFAELAKVRFDEPWLAHISAQPSEYREGRKIGDEYEYILRRRHLKKFPGNMLPRPSLLLNPWAVQSTENQANSAKPGGEFGGSDANRSAAKRKPKSQSIAETNSTDFASLDFLDPNTVLLTNLTPDKDGRVRVDLEKIGNRQHIRIVAVNDRNAIERHTQLPLQKLSPRDSRLADAMAPDEHFVQSKRIDVLAKGDEIRIAESSSARFQHYDSLQDVFRLYRALHPHPNLDQFSFILTWHSLNDDEKRALYSRYASHELNFFLYKKDSAFFKEVVQPHLTNKRDRTFLDRWLLKEDLSEYIQPWNFARLNAMERILLAQQMESQAADIIRSLDESYFVRPKPKASETSIFERSMGGVDLDGDGDGLIHQFGYKSSRKNLPRLSDGVYFATPSDGQAPAEAGGVIRGNKGFQEDLKLSFGVDSRVAGQSINGKFEQLQRGESLGVQDLAGGEISRYRAAELGKISAGTTFKAGREIAGIKRVEQRIRSLADGTKETYLVEVPDSENSESITANFARQAPSPDYLAFYEPTVVDEFRRSVRRLYRRIAATREWIENNYFHLLPEQQNPGLVSINGFWRDYANHKRGPFLSSAFPEAHQTFTEMMFALSVLDLPFEEPKHQTEYVDSSLQFTAGGATILLHQQIEESVFERGNTTILVSENFFQANDRYRHEDDVRFDKFVSDRFSAHTLYGAQVVVTNPTSTPRKIDVLIQVPEGSVACKGSQETRTIKLDLAAFSSNTIEYHFYFPTAGKFSHFPAHVSSDEKILAVSDGTAFNVVDEPVKIDETSWQFVSQNGSNDEVINFLNEQNILRIDLAKIAFRMKDKDFFSRTISTLRNRYVYNQTLWSYSIKHNVAAAISEYLRHNDEIAANCGMSFNSALLNVDPVKRNWYQHREYWPLINARSHQIGPQRKILNPSFAAQYQKLLNILANRKSLSHNDHLTITYYMLLQDRIETALSHFDKVDPKQIDASIQYDYCDAYLDMYRENPSAAAQKAAKWADYPVDHWRNRFRNILAQVEEINGGETNVVDDENQTQTQTQQASKSESFEFEIADHQATIRYQNMERATVNYYEMDIELLFSRSPFALQNLSGFSMIRANMTQHIELDKKKQTHVLDLPPELQNKNVLVEIVAGDQTRSQPSFANALDVQVFENQGQLKVTNESDSAALPKTYVKVYAKLSNGQVRFHKDGYTDLRGRFDYVTQSNHSLDGIERFSLLIMSDEHGALMKQANPPKE